MAPRYKPFEKDLSDISPDDLATLKDVHEGWHVEYKSELIKPRDLAKSLSSFANQFGGWIFFGVLEDKKSRVAGSFPGIPNSEVPDALESVRNASKDRISPEVFYNPQVFEGPIDSIELPVDRSIIVIQIPEGADCPYVHNDGRIYRRIDDASDPKPETDRARLDLLIERGNRARSLLANRVTQIPDISAEERHRSYIHMSIISDPYETLGHEYSAGFSKFSEIMRQSGLLFDNIYPKSGGYIARRTKGENAHNRVLTWEFSRHCHSFITFPVPPLRLDGADSDLPPDTIYDQFNSMLIENGLSEARILNLNFTMVALMYMIKCHRQLAWHANIRGPFYVKAYLQNIWRTVPFVDLPAFLKHISEYGFPVLQDRNILVPHGHSLDTFLLLPEHAIPESELINSEEVRFFHMIDSFAITYRILEAFGITPETVKPLSGLISRYVRLRGVRNNDRCSLHRSPPERRSDRDL